MALGGGIFITQNKVLPGAYINFVSANNRAAALGERGYAAMGFELDWGIENEIFTVTSGDIQKNSMKFFGYEYTNDKLKGIRDIFKNIKTLYAYRLNGGAKAENTFAKAKYSGVRGNDIKIGISVNADDEDKFDVVTYVGNIQADIQTVESSAELVSNDWVDFKSAELAVTAPAALSGGTNGTVSGQSHQNFLDKLEKFSFNALGVVTTDTATKALYTAFTKRMRDEVGLKFQTVVYNYTAA